MTLATAARRWIGRIETQGKALALIAASVLAYVAAYELRFDFALGPQESAEILSTLPILVAARWAAAWYWQLHRQWWRFVSIVDLRSIVAATLAGSVAFALVLPWLFGWRLPRSVLLIEPILSFLLVAGMMVTSRWLRTGRPGLRRSAASRVLIVGAGQTGHSAARELLSDPAGRYLPVGFADDDPKKEGVLIHGIPVLGKLDEIGRLVDQQRADEIIIALPSTSRRRLREVVELCKASGARFRLLPAQSDVLHGRVTVNALREVRIEDLLGRPPVSFDLDSVRPLIHDAVALVTGASGSIGSELCRQVAACGPARLLMLDRNENNLHFLHTEMLERFPRVELVPLVADIGDPLRVERLMRAERPRVVFQAAAYKHVPLMEGNPCEAIRNNVIGTGVVAQMAACYGAERFVMISTDKAINPTSVMGSSKRVAELLLQSLQPSSRTRFVTVRFGNVLGSDGSVIPLFRRQIARGGPVTVTHPDVVRYFMLVDEAVHLVLQASVFGQGGEIYLLDMGEPVRILDLAADMIRLSGLEPNVDIEMRITGLRPGEKLYEELITDSEVAARTGHPMIFRLNEQNHRDWRQPRKLIEELEALALAGNDEGVRAKLHELVPEFHSPAHRAADALAARPRVRPLSVGGAAHGLLPDVSSEALHSQLRRALAQRLAARA